MGRLAEARPSLARAQARAPLDAEVTGLWALLAELEGRDEEADRGYRAALALRVDEGQAAPDPYEGLARLGAYGGARPVQALPPALGGAAVFVVGEPRIELGRLPGGPDPIVVVLALGLGAGGARHGAGPRGGPHGHGALFLRAGEGPAAGGASPRGFVLLAEALTTESLASALERIGAGHVRAGESTLAHLDVPGVEAWSAA